jgi:hypothetical protein
VQKVAARHRQAQTQSASRQRHGIAVAPPHAEQIARLAAVANDSPAMVAQRKLVEGIDNSSRAIAQRVEIASALPAARSVRAERPPVIQRTVDGDSLSVWSETGTLPPLQGYQSLQKQRDYYETVMMKEELLRRYHTVDAIDDDLIEAAVELANRNPINTTLTIRQAITDAESQLNFQSTATVSAAPTTSRARFIQNLEDRRGSYNWASGRSKTFTTWISLPNPMGSPLPTDAQINCWEAVLASAAEAGLVGIQALRDAYQEKDAANALLDKVFGPKVRGTIQHPADGPNGIAEGDFILISGSDGPLHHVVVAVGESPTNYKLTPVMSLWSAVGGGSFIRTNLGNVLEPKTQFVYGSF